MARAIVWHRARLAKHAPTPDRNDNPGVGDPRSGYALPVLANTRINWPGFAPPNGRLLLRR